jgi:type II secretion system protein N
MEGRRMSLPPWSKKLGYPGWFALCFFVSLYLTFPLDMVRPMVMSVLEDALGKGKQGRYGVDPVVKIDGLTLWRMSGVRLSRVSLQLGSTDPDPGPVLELDSLGVRVGLIGMLVNSPRVYFDADLYGGDLSGSVALTGDEQAADELYGNVRALLKGKPVDLASLSLDVDGIDVARSPPVLAKVGVPATGVLGGKVELALGTDPSQDSSGEVNLKLAQVTLGPGELAIPVPGLTGGLSVPLIDMGDFLIKGKIKDGKGAFEELAITGTDLNASANLDVTMGSTVKLSRLKGEGYFQVSNDFLDKNSKFKTILDFAAPLKKARDDQGRYQFSVAGTLDKPRFDLASGANKR